MTDTVFVKNLAVFARHGVFMEEATLGQRFFLDIACHTSTRAAAEADDPALTACYDQVCRIATETITGERSRLLETVAERICHNLFAALPMVFEIHLEIRKPSAPVSAIVDTVGVRVERRRDD
ncbi:MAG: dihydroneopterin aldolase [Pseudomonadota bacterium]